MYEPPKSSTVVNDDALKDGSVVKAVLLAFLLDVGGTIAVSVLVSFFYGIYLTTLGLSGDDMLAMISSPGLTEPHNVLAQGMGLLISFYAGLFCCRSAGKNARKAIVILAAFMVTFGLVVGATVYPVWANILIALVGAGVYYLAYKRFLTTVGKSLKTIEA